MIPGFPARALACLTAAIIPITRRGLRFLAGRSVLDDMGERLDPESLVGLHFEEAKEIVERHGYVAQVLHPVAPPLKQGLTLDLRAKRIRLITDGERVTRAWNG